MCKMHFHILAPIKNFSTLKTCYSNKFEGKDFLHEGNFNLTLPDNNLFYWRFYFSKSNYESGKQLRSFATPQAALIF